MAIQRSSSPDHLRLRRPTSLLTLFNIAIILTALISGGVDAAEGQGQSSSSSSSGNALYHNHQMGDESIDVSSSIGVSGANGGSSADGANNGGGKQMMHSGHVEDLLANESGEGDGPKVVAMGGPPMHQGNFGPSQQGPGLSHAVVVDSEHDLLGAETEPKFSLSKFKRPFARLPTLDSLRFNNRFLNGILAAGSHPTPQRAIPPNGPFGGPNNGPQFGNRQPPPQHLRGPGPPPGGPGPNFGPGPLRGGGPPPPFGHPHPQNQHGHPQQAPPSPIYKALNMPPGGGNGNGMPQMNQQQQPKFSMPPFMGHQTGAMNNQESYHVIEEPMTITVPSNQGGQPSDDIMHSISDFIGSSSENGRINGGGDGDLDLGRPMLSAPPSNDIWPLSQPELPKIVNLDVKCEKNFMKVSVEFDRPYNGMIFSKGHFSSPHCIHMSAGSGRTHIYFDIRMDSCGTTGNMGASNALTAPGGVSPTGTFFENTVIFQYDPFLQEAWDQARKLRCTWHDQYEKSVSFRPFPVDMVDVVRADFAGDNVGCWMQIQVGRGPWASEVAGIVKIGQTMTMVLAIKDEENKFDMLVRNCVAHDGKRAPIELVDTNGCIVRSKLMSRFTKIKNFGSSASVLSYAHFQAFKFPDSMEVHFQCTIQICKHRCPEQCDTSGSASGLHYSTHQISGSINTGSGNVGNMVNHQSSQSPFAESLYLEGGHGGLGGSESPSRGDSVLARPREIRDVSAQLDEDVQPQNSSAQPISKDIGVNKVIRVVSSGDLSFATSDRLTQESDSSAGNSSETSSPSGHLDSARSWLSEKLTYSNNEKICMSSLNFVVCFATLAALLLTSITCSVVLCCRKRASEGAKKQSAKESILTAKMVLGAATAAQHRSEYTAAANALHSHPHHQQQHSQTAYHSNGTSASAGQMLSNAHAYLGSSSVLSPRVQASNGQQTTSQQNSSYAHHRSSDLYHS